MTRWHTSTELRLTAADAVGAKAPYLAAGLDAGYALGLKLDAARVELEARLSGTSDTGG